MTDARLAALADAAREYRRRRREDWPEAQVTAARSALYDALEALPAPAQGETVEVAVWQHADGSTRFSRPNSPDDEWNGWRRIGTTLLPIRATVEGGGE
jgi:hypothetical protein